jgi:hypothetical protein
MKQINKEEFIKVCKEAESMRQASQKLNMHFNTFKRYAIKFECYQTHQSNKGRKLGHYSTRIPTEDILAGKYPTYPTYKLKLRLFEEGYLEDRCCRCGWHEKLPGAKHTPCELHHKDGDSSNHAFENLEIICPNCHSLTPTYRARNKK